jgi:hypothetical protein
MLFLVISLTGPRHLETSAASGMACRLDKAGGPCAQILIISRHARIKHTKYLHIAQLPPLCRCIAMVMAARPSTRSLRQLRIPRVTCRTLNDPCIPAAYGILCSGRFHCTRSGSAIVDVSIGVPISDTTFLFAIRTSSSR